MCKKTVTPDGDNPTAAAKRGTKFFHEKAFRRRRTPPRRLPGWFRARRLATSKSSDGFAHHGAFDPGSRRTKAPATCRVPSTCPRNHPLLR